MRTVRALIFGLPLLLAALIGASFAAVSLYPRTHRNQLAVGTIGEAKQINPIISSTAADSQVESYIFQGLLSYDENLEIRGELARAWEESQLSTIFFHNAISARKAAEQIAALKERWPDWHLAAAEAEGDELRLRFHLPGTRASREIRALLPPDDLLPATVLRVRVKSAAADSARHFREHAVNAASIRRVWVNTSMAYELTVVGDGKEVAEELRAHYAANPDAEGDVAVGETLPLLDEPEVVFHLREGIRWHDGAPFTSADVDFTFQMIMAESVASPRRPDYELIARLETPDPLTARVVYRRPYSPALNSWMMGIVPKHILAGKPTSWWAENFNRRPVGTGPFRFREWRPGEHILLERNPDYHRGPPHLETVAVRTIPDQVAIRLAFETRQIDFWGVDQHAVSHFASDPRFSIFQRPSNNYEYVGWNLRRPLFQDPRVRRALAHAVDVDSIIRFVLYGFGSRSQGIYPSTLWFHNHDVKTIPYDPEAARALLAEAGWVPGSDGMLAKEGERFTFTLITNQAHEVRKDIATLVQADLRKLGIDAKVEIYEWTVFIGQKIDKLDFDAAVLGWVMGYDYDAYQIWHSSQTNPGQLNFVGYQNPEADRLIEELRTTYEKERIIELAGRLQQMVYDDQPYLFLYVPIVTTALWKESLRIYRPTPSGWLDEPLRMTKAGLAPYQEWLYRTDHKPALRP